MGAFVTFSSVTIGAVWGLSEIHEGELLQDSDTGFKCLGFCELTASVTFIYTVTKCLTGVCLVLIGEGDCPLQEKTSDLQLQCGSRE